MMEISAKTGGLGRLDPGPETATRSVGKAKLPLSQRHDFEVGGPIDYFFSF